MYRKSAFWAIRAILMVLTIAISSCAPQASPTPVTIVKKETEIVRETQVVVVTATPAPHRQKPALPSLQLPSLHCIS
ncbi:MAG: hypothetical protein ACUVR2_07930 [Anaerolineae bacterium]